MQNKLYFFCQAATIVSANVKITKENNITKTKYEHHAIDAKLIFQHEKVNRA